MFLMIFVFFIVLDLARMKFNFYTEAFWVLCSGLMARTLLVAHLCFVYCWTVHAYPAWRLSVLSFVPCEQPERGGYIAKRADQIWLMHYLLTCDISLSNESSARWERRDLCGSGICLPKQPLCFCPISPGATSSREWQTLLIFLSIQLLLFLLKCHCLYLWVFSHSFFFVHILQIWVKS